MSAVEEFLRNAGGNKVRADKVCRYPKCEKKIRYIPSKFKWVHVTPGADHAPVP